MPKSKIYYCLKAFWWEASTYRHYATESSRFFHATCLLRVLLSTKMSSWHASFERLCGQLISSLSLISSNGGLPDDSISTSKFVCTTENLVNIDLTWESLLTSVEQKLFKGQASVKTTLVQFFSPAIGVVIMTTRYHVYVLMGKGYFSNTLWKSLNVFWSNFQ